MNYLALGFCIICVTNQYNRLQNQRKFSVLFKGVDYFKNTKIHSNFMASGTLCFAKTFKRL